MFANESKMIYKILLTYVLLLPYLAQAQSAKEIIKQADEKMRGTTSKSFMIMKIVRPEWTREISMKSWTVGNEKSLILITSPARDRGSVFLKREKEIWNWQPSIDRMIKLPPSMMMQSWMGSDFKNDDLVRESSIVHDYEHSLASDTVINGYSAYKIVLTPHEFAPVVWGKIIAYIDQKDLLQLLTKYYDEDGYLINTLTFSEIKEMGGRIIPTTMEMVPTEEEGHKTIIEYKSMEFDLQIKDTFFSIQNAKRVR